MDGYIPVNMQGDGMVPVDGLNPAEVDDDLLTDADEALRVEDLLIMAQVFAG